MAGRREGRRANEAKGGMARRKRRTGRGREGKKDRTENKERRKF